MIPKRSRWVLGGIVSAALVALVCVPLFELARGAVVDRTVDFGEIVGSGELTEPVRNTILSALAVTALATAIATAAALFIERGSLGLRSWLRAGVILPLLIPPFVSALSWASAYGPGGLLDDVVGVSVPGLFGPLGVVAVITVNVVPLAYLVVASAIATRGDIDLELAARVAGAKQVTVLRTVTLPAILPAVVGAAALTFVVAINAFGIPAVLGTPAGFPTVTTRIYQDLALSADSRAFARVLVLAVLLVLVTLVTVGATSRHTNDRRRPLHRVETPSALPRTAGRRQRVVAAAVAAYVVASSLLPLLALVLMALTRAVGLSPTPGNWTMANFSEAFAAGSWRSLGNSVLLAAEAATIVLLLAAALIVVASRRATSQLGTLVTLTFAVPGSALAVAVFLAYGSWLRGSLTLILVAYLAKFWALGHRPLAGAVTAIPPDLVRAARVSGAPPVTVIRTVLAPMLKPALLAGWLLVFLFGLHELTMSILLYGPRSSTLAVVALNLQQLGDPTVTAALAVALTLLVLFAAAPLALVWRSWNKMGTR